jgi:hypothetical protein
LSNGYHTCLLSEIKRQLFSNLSGPDTRPKSSLLTHTFFLFFSFPFHSPLLPLPIGLPLRSYSFIKSCFCDLMHLLCYVSHNIKLIICDCPSVIQFRRLMLKPVLHYRLLPWVLCYLITLLIYLLP